MPVYREPGDYPHLAPPKRKRRRKQRPDSQAALRVLTTLRLLLTGPHSVAQLAEACGRDAKTVRRDIAVIAAAGFAVRSRTEEYGRKIYRVIKRPKKCPIRRNSTPSLAPPK